MFDAVVRTGFHKAAKRPLGPELQRAGAQSVVEFPFYEPAPENLLQDLLARPAKYALFIDDAVNFSATALKKLARLGAMRADAEALCISTPTSRKYMTLLGAPTAAGSVGATAVGAMYLVPWCVLVPKAVLQHVDLARAQGSLTAMLLGLHDHVDTILAVGAEPDELDIASWLVDVLGHEHERLSRGLADSLQSPGTLHPQFRFTTRGEYIDVDHAVAATGSVRFSVICPVFKSRFLKEAVDSVLSQSYDNLEFLITVDGPPAEEEAAIRAVLDEFAQDPRLKVAYRENVGTGRARAALAEAATGDYLVSLDDDDLFTPHTLEYFARAIEQRDGRPPAALRGGTQIFGFAERYLAPRPRLLVDGLPCDFFEANQPWCLHTKTLRANGGLVGDPKLRHCGEDADYFLRLDSMPHLDSLLIDEPLYLRRLSTMNQTLSFTPEEFHAHLAEICSNYIPDGYKFIGNSFEDERPYVRQVARYVESKSGREVFAATRYFNYSLSAKAQEVIIDLELTALCNADCTFCPRENLGRTDKYLSMDIVREIADQVKHDGMHRKIVLCGIGEPTLHPQVYEIVEILTAAGAEVCMTNNGSRMDAERFERLATAGLKEVNFSVNAATEETRQLVMKQKNFARVKENIRTALALRDEKFPDIQVHVSFVLCPQNHHEVDDFVQEWQGSAANALWIHPVNNRARLLTAEYGEYDPLEIARRYARNPRVIVDLWDHGFPSDNKHVCSIAQATQFISADGEVLLCALDHERKNIIGHVMERPLVFMQMQKLDEYRHGKFDAFCEGCTYCPKTHKSVAVHL
jgi:MoaA/NifB/PqqE/SkfB family radical SAM enzyme